MSLFVTRDPRPDYFQELILRVSRERFPLPDAESFATCLRVESFCGKRLGRATLNDFTSALSEVLVILHKPVFIHL